MLLIVIKNGPVFKYRNNINLLLKSDYYLNIIDLFKKNELMEIIYGCIACRV